MTHAAHQMASDAPETRTERFPVTDLYCVCCAESLEAALKASPHIERARVDFQNDAVEATHHPTMISPQEIETLISQSGCCSSVSMPSTDMTHLHHRAQMAEVTAGTKQDRMQYEMPSTSAHKEHEHAHHEAKGHAGMDHDMSDPKMAKAMETDMQNRFLVALVLTIPTILYSPLGTDFFGLGLPSGIGKSWLALILSTPVVWWAGWIFIGGAFRSLRHRALNMSVLIATGVLAAYLSSVVLTIVGEEDTFYEAGAMLVTFVLFGHWMEMKSRRGTTDALRALFDLVPASRRSGPLAGGWTPRRAECRRRPPELTRLARGGRLDPIQRDPICTSCPGSPPPRSRCLPRRCTPMPSRRLERTR